MSGSNRLRKPARRSGALGSLLRVVLIVLLVAYGYSLVPSNRLPEAIADVFDPYRPPPAAQPLAKGRANPVFECDGRKMCAEMTSCAEARYFVSHCPNTQMDASREGGPCKLICD